MPLKRVGIILGKDHAYALNMRRGIVQFVQSSAHWFFHTATESTPEDFRRFKVWKPEGLIAEVSNPTTIRIVNDLRVPTIDVSIYPQLRTPYYVGIDHAKVGALAAEHFLSRGLRQFAYFGYRNPCCLDQLGAFESAITSAGGKVTSLFSGDIPYKAEGWRSADKFLAQWLKKLPKPVGLFLHDDGSAMWLLQPCRLAGLRIPEDVAILGVNNDENNCLFAFPPVSSISVPDVRVGFEAARMLHQLMNGQKPVQKKVFFAPTGVTLRQSSDLIAVDDSTLAEALRWIHAHADKPMNVAQMVRELHVSRRLLERRFQKTLERTPAEEIRRAHAERARQLIAQTSLPLRVIATQSGHRDIYHLSSNFKRWLGKTPSIYRREVRP